MSDESHDADYYREETMRDKDARDRQMRGHFYDPTCGCDDCQWKGYVDDKDTMELEFEEDQAENRYNRDNR